MKAKKTTDTDAEAEAVDAGTIDLAEFAPPPGGWARLDRAAACIGERHVPWRAGRDPHSLGERARSLGLDVVPSVGAAGIAVRVADLGRLLSPAELEAIRPDLGELEAEAIGLQTARNLTGLKSLRDRDLVELLARRGVAVDRTSGRPEVSMSQVIWFSRILAAERRHRNGESDLHPASVALPLLRRAMSAGPGDDDMDPDAELEWYSERLDIRGDTRPVDNGYRTRSVPTAGGWDLFRLAGILVPGADVEGYRRRLSEARAAVLGSPDRPAAEERIITHNGRKFLVEAGA
jgi:hypothetical protein